MKKNLVYSFLIILAIILQTSVFSMVFKSYMPGDVVLMLVLAGVVLDGFFGFFWWAIFAGILYDIAAYERVGVHALIFLLLVYFVSFFSRRFTVEFRGVGLMLFFVFVFVGSLISRAVIALAISWDMQNFQRYFEIFGGFGSIFFQTLANVLLFICCLLILRKAKSFFEI